MAIGAAELTVLQQLECAIHVVLAQGPDGLQSGAVIAALPRVAQVWLQQPIGQGSRLVERDRIGQRRMAGPGVSRVRTRVSVPSSACCDGSTSRP